ncbi:MAG TPA: hypothetical protein ENG87_01230 [Candidatus Pacearchaeota archaeon]|nr:hypothetical protein BMS3Abin17_00454 [archaeon BMS3Abin17]HDK41973.1 hypothetical protein [Candidatus Pacearchaeota archaeon]HDZ61128.1 hypothetical protein [Candidatus Pacearchaeota archaeon]
MKRGLGLSLLITSIFLISFVSAYGSYTSFSFSDFLDQLDSSMMILGSIFIICFILFNFSLSKFFRDNRPIAGTISFVLSLLTIWGINKTGLDYENFLSNIGLSGDLLSIIVPAILIIGAIIFIWKVGFSGFFIIFGILIGVLTVFTEFFYEKGISGLMGIIFLLIGLWLWRRKKKIASGYSYTGGVKPSGSGLIGKGLGAVAKGGYQAGKYVASKYDWEKEKRQAKAIGRGTGWLGRKGVALGKKGLENQKRATQEAKERDEAYYRKKEQEKAQKQQERMAQKKILQKEILIWQNKLRQLINTPNYSIQERSKIEGYIKKLEKHLRSI